MINLKQITTAALMGAALMCSFDVMAGSCKVGSHTSHDWIKARNKNCQNCGTQTGSKGEKVYYCYCDCETKSDNTASATKASGAKKCTKDQYLVNGKCTKCPNHGSCDGSKVTKCNKTFEFRKMSDGTRKCSCPQGWYYAEASDKCYSCPKNATCPARKAISCNKGYEQKVASDGQITCQKKTTSAAKTTNKSSTSCKAGQYVVNGQCKACPAKATCDGENVTCTKTGYKRKVKAKDGTLTCECEWYNSYYKECVSCPKNSICYGDDKPECKKGYGRAWYDKRGQSIDSTANRDCYKCPDHASSCTYNSLARSTFVSLDCEDGYRQEGSTCAKLSN